MARWKKAKTDPLYREPPADRRQVGSFGTGTLNVGADYTQEQLEFTQAMERWMKKTRRRFPAFTDCLAVLKSLGYRKVAEPEPLPTYSDILDSQ